MFVLNIVSDYRHNLDKSLVIDPERSLHHADLGESQCFCVATDDQHALSLNDNYNEYISNVLYFSMIIMYSVCTDGRVC